MSRNEIINSLVEKVTIFHKEIVYIFSLKVLTNLGSNLSVGNMVLL